MTNTQKKAIEELKLYCEKNKDVEFFVPEILAFCEKFGNSGQSGGSAPHVANQLTSILKKYYFKKLLLRL